MNKSKRYCSVPQCNNYYSENISLHYFPKDLKVRQAWIHACKIGKTVSKYMNVCSEHFNPTDFVPAGYRAKLGRKKLKRDAVPTQKLPVGSFPKQKKSSSRDDRTIKRNINKTASNLIADLAIETTAEQPMELSFIIETNVSSPQPQPSCSYVSLESESSAKISVTRCDKECQINLGMCDIKETLIDCLIQSDKNMCAYTGINIKTFVKIEQCMQMASSTWKMHSKNIRERTLLVLVKLKTDLTFRALAVMFKISFTTAQNYFHDTINIMGQSFLKLIYFPTRDVHYKNLPKCFSRYKNVRMVLDATEIKVQKSKCLTCNIRTYSNYKKNHTIKYMIGVTPPGTICFVSPGYGGRTSDKTIINNENCLQLLDPFIDAVMVDKGILIEQECLDNGIRLVRPPFLREKKQLSKAQAIETANIARARVHVERAIQRIKLFRIFNRTVEFSLLPYIDNIMNLICALVNLSQPILSDDKF